MKISIQNKVIAILFALAHLNGCIPPKLTTKLKVEPLSDNEALEYTKAEGLYFDLQYRINDLTMLQDFKNYGMEALTFVNLYSPSGELLRTVSGEKCEFRVLSYIRDSIQSSVFKPSDCDSCTFDFITTNKARLISGNSEIALGKYKVVLGWAKFLKNNALLRQRSKELLSGISSLRSNQKDLVIIGLNFDPIVANESKSGKK